MPGLLIMNHNGADARDGENRKRTHDGKLVNGQLTPRGDGATANGSSINGASTPLAGSTVPTAEQKFAELPPEIAHLSSEHYHPLSTLVQRISQECYNGLNDVLREMAEVEINQHPNGLLTNGLGGHLNGLQNSSKGNKDKKLDGNQQKKLLLMDFAQHNRAKFIKLLVLTEWGKKSAVEIAQVIDLFQWTRDQSFGMDNAHIQMDQIKLLTAHSREPNPDVRTALEILSKGRAEWIPDMGYIPPEPISSEKALKLLKYMNTSLAIRLIVHENLPRHLKKWRIASGRVTFVIDSEFEMDVMSFSEDTTEQWLFIDLRLLFSPAPTIAVGTRFQAYFKPHMDRILSESGLSGCFDFLHNFVLTHKISILKSQAYQLLRAGWSGSIKVEPIHRSLVVQYWTDRPGRKSWIEIGISSLKPKNGKTSWRGAPISSPTVRWFRHGVEVKDADLIFDFNNLSMERILKKVISMHIGHFLRTTRDALPSRMTAKLSLSDNEPCDCVLEVSLGRPENTTTISMEAVTGRYILRPCTSMAARAEQAINQARDPLATTSSTIAQLLAQRLQDVIQRHASQLGWRSVEKHALRLDTIKQATKLDVLQYALFWPSGWTDKWALAALIDASGETWWFLELGGKAATIEYAEQLKTEKTGPSPPISRATLSSVERLAVQQLAFCVTRRELHNQHISSSVRNELSFPSSTGPTTSSHNALRGWVLHLRTSELLLSKPGEESWLDPYVRVMCQGFKADYRNVSHIASGTMVKSIAADMQKLMSSSPQSNFTFSENGNFAILLTSRFGEPIIDELKARLRDVDRLRSFTTILQKRKMKLKSSSLQHVQFRYGENLTATVNFGEANSDKTQNHPDAKYNIRVDFGPGNPHNRIRKYLSGVINEQTPFSMPRDERTGLDRFCSTLILTRPILTTLAELETATPGNLHNPAVYAHGIGRYRLTYANPLCSFDVQLRQKDDKVLWYIEDNDKKPIDSKPSTERNKTRSRLETLKAALSNLFKKKGQGWFGIRSGMLAEIDGVSDALMKLHQTIMSCAVEDGAQPYKEEPALPSATNTNGPANPNNNARPAPNNNNNNNNNNKTTPASVQRVNFPNIGKQVNHMNHMNGKKQQEVIELD